MSYTLQSQQRSHAWAWEEVHRAERRSGTKSGEAEAEGASGSSCLSTMLCALRSGRPQDPVHLPLSRVLFQHVWSSSLTAQAKSMAFAFIKGYMTQVLTLAVQAFPKSTFGRRKCPCRPIPSAGRLQTLSQIKLEPTSMVHISKYPCKSHFLPQ